MYKVTGTLATRASVVWGDSLSWAHSSTHIVPLLHGWHNSGAGKVVNKVSYLMRAIVKYAWHHYVMSKSMYKTVLGHLSQLDICICVMNS